MSNGNDLKRTHGQFTSQMYDYVFNEEEMKKRKENKEKKTRREKALPFFQSPSENRMWILEFACYPRPSIKIKSTINITLMKKVSTFSTIMANQKINYDFTHIFFYNNVIKSHQYSTLLSMPYFSFSF